MLLRIISTRSSSVNMPLGLVGLCITPTTTSPNNATDCSITSRWPRWNGSKLPGYSTVMMGGVVRGAMRRLTLLVGVE